ncbi:MAG: PDZ domain-containing protein [Patescibacteria group bacterium]|jgi:S1-C subfamily serine protease
MKKLLIALLIIIIIIVVAQRFGLLTYFSPNPTPSIEKRVTNEPTVDISQVSNPPIIGIHYRMIDAQTALQNKLVEGAYITQIIQGSPVEKANLQEEDIITEVDGNKIGGADKQTLINLVSVKRSGEKINLKIWRNKEIKTVIISLN